MKGELITRVNKVEVFYDGHCGMCASFAEWLLAQDRHWEVICLPYQGDEAQRSFRELVTMEPSREMVVRVDGERVYRGAEGWVWCLWGTVKYRDVAKLMSSRVMLPMAKKVCYLVAKNRVKVSKLLFGKKAQEVADELHQLEQKSGGSRDGGRSSCGGGCEI